MGVLARQHPRAKARDGSLLVSGTISLQAAAHLFAERVGAGGWEQAQKGLCLHAFTFPTGLCVQAPQGMASLLL